MIDSKKFSKDILCEAAKGPEVQITDGSRNYPMNLECFVEDLFLGGQWSIILGYRRLSVKSLLVQTLFLWAKRKRKG